MQIKICEGMVMGKATVSTSFHPEGLEVNRDCYVLHGGRSDLFAKRMVMLFSCRKMRSKDEVVADRVSGQLKNAFGAFLPNPVSREGLGEDIHAMGEHEDTRP